jgi:hypothetical protein
MCATLLAAFFMFKSLFAKIQATNRKDTHSKRKDASLERQARILKSLYIVSSYSKYTRALTFKNSENLSTEKFHEAALTRK